MRSDTCRQTSENKFWPLGFHPEATRQTTTLRFAPGVVLRKGWIQKGQDTNKSTRVQRTPVVLWLLTLVRCLKTNQLLKNSPQLSLIDCACVGRGCVVKRLRAAGVVLTRYKRVHRGYRADTRTTQVSSSPAQASEPYNETENQAPP